MFLAVWLVNRVDRVERVDGGGIGYGRGEV